jgi:hypothetical protein
MNKIILQLFLLLFLFNAYSQEGKGNFRSSTLDFKYVSSISDQINEGTFIYAEESNGPEQERKDKKLRLNKAVVGKGLPLGDDPLLYNQDNAILKNANELSLIFETMTSSNSCPSDPTGAVGPNHYLAAWNSAYQIYDKSGNNLTPASSLSSLFGPDNFGDPVVLYDAQIDRFVITSMGQSSIQLAMSETSDPVNGGWYVYSSASSGGVFETTGLPDYPHYAIWSDGYYVSVNANANDFYVLERDKIIDGDPTASIQAGTAPSLYTGGLASPHFLSVTGDSHPVDGNATMVYFQDDSWGGVSQDHLKLWTVNVDWNNSNNSTISNPSQINTTSFNSVFDGGSFQNLTLPNGYDIDACQGIVMQLAQYRKFPSYNSAVFNFTIDVDGSTAKRAGIRWYELRQTDDGEPWTIYQEGTYTAPGNANAFVGSMAMDSQGNIGMGYTSMSTSAPISINYTGRYASDPLNQMTISEENIATSTSNPNSCGGRYADYAQLSVDPEDDKTFWFVSEYFSPTRKDIVGVFKIAPNFANDIGVVSIDSPSSGTLTSEENISVSIFNYGEDSASNFDITYQLDSGDLITETYTGSIASNETGEFTFSTTVDLSVVGTLYQICAYTSLSGDEDSSNDNFCGEIEHLNSNDLGISAISSPISGTGLSSTELVTVEITNYGGADQSDFEVSYEVNDEITTEIVPGPVPAGGSIDYIFTQSLDLSTPGGYLITAYTSNDSDNSNNSFSYNVSNYAETCTPVATAGCNLDGIKQFILNTINVDDGDIGCNSENSSGAQGYADRRDLFTDLSRSDGENVYSIQAMQLWSSETSPPFSPGDEGFAAWIDFNDNGIFESSELLIDSSFQTSGTLEDFALTIPTSAELGSHTLRVKAIDITAGDNLTNPCDNFSYGEVHDYTVNIVETLGVNNINLYNSEFKIISLDDNQFNISLATNYSDNISFSVYDISGKILVFNNIYKESDKYIYDLDMSYAASGIYLVKMGNSELGYKFGKIIVK